MIIQTYVSNLDVALGFKLSNNCSFVINAVNSTCKSLQQPHDMSPNANTHTLHMAKSENWMTEEITNHSSSSYHILIFNVYFLLIGTEPHSEFRTKRHLSHGIVRLLFGKVKKHLNNTAMRTHSTVNINPFLQCFHIFIHKSKFKAFDRELKLRTFTTSQVHETTLWNKLDFCFPTPHGL